MQTGLVGFFSLLPFVLSSALGGVIVDRLGYRRASIVSDLASGVTVLAIPVLARTVGVPLAALLALVFAGALLDAPGQTASEAILPDLVERAGTTLERGTSLFDGVSRAREHARRAARRRADRRRSAPSTSSSWMPSTFAVSALLMRGLRPGRRARRRKPPTSRTSHSSARGSASSGGRRSCARSS